MKIFKTLDLKGYYKGKQILFTAPYTLSLYTKIKKYFEINLLSSLKEINDRKLQSILNKKANTVKSLKSFNFDDDVRIIEIAVTIGLLETLHKCKKLNKDFIYIPCWQLPKQQKVTKELSNKESWDGFFLCLNKKSGAEAIPIPIEIKSLMHDPNEEILSNPNDQLKKKIKKFQPFFQKEGSFNCVLLMPYTNEDILKIDIKEALINLNKNSSPQTGGCICQLSFPKDEKGYQCMSLYFALLPEAKTVIDIKNVKGYVCEVNFGKVKH